MRTPKELTQIGLPYLPEWRQDPYQCAHRWADPSICIDCGAVYRLGRWAWPLYPEDGEWRTCPACRRIRDAEPAGVLTIKGHYLLQHQRDIELLVFYFVDREREAEPLKRLMGHKRLSDGSQLLTFTEPHLAAQVGEMLQRAYEGELGTEYRDGEYLVRIQLTREH